MPLTVAIVGAGISGLACARDLRSRGHAPVVFEKSRAVGGRVATRREAGFVWDTGATSIVPRGKSLEGVMLRELDTSDLVRVEKPVFVHRGLRVASGDASRRGERYTYRTGNRTLARLLAEGLDVRLETSVDEIHRAGDRFEVRGERYDAVVLTPPVPQTSLFLWGLGESRPVALARYRPCLSVNLGFAAPLPEVPYHALIDADRRHPLTWLSLESVKSPGRAPEGGCALGAQLSDAFSLANYGTPDEELVSVVTGFVRRLYGDDFPAPVVSTVMRWKYSQPTGVADFDEVNPPGSRLLVAGDGLLGGHVEDAFEVGCRAATRLVGAN